MYQCSTITVHDNRLTSMLIVKLKLLLPNADWLTCHILTDFIPFFNVICFKIMSTRPNYDAMMRYNLLAFSL